MTPEKLRPDFRNQFPEFNEVEDAEVLKYLRVALVVYNLNALGTLYLAAHYLFLAQPEAPDSNLGDLISIKGLRKNGVTSVSVDSKKVDFSNDDIGTHSVNSEAFFELTDYGITFLQIAKVNRPISFGVA